MALTDLEVYALTRLAVDDPAQRDACAAAADQDDPTLPIVKTALQHAQQVLTQSSLTAQQLAQQAGAAASLIA